MRHMRAVDLPWSRRVVSPFCVGGLEIRSLRVYGLRDPEMTQRDLDAHPG